MLLLRTFGGLSLEDGGRPIVGATAQRGRLAILAVLAAAGDRGISRDRLLTTFWSESDAERARGALNQALYALRRDAAETELTLGTTELRLNPTAIGSDVADFDRALAAGDIDRVVELYTGAFLDGIHLHDSPEFERWVDQERERLAQAYQSALERLARATEGRGDHAAAIRWWRKLAAADSLSASVTKALMQALVAAGDTTAALRHARVYTALVRQELGAAPDPAVLELAEQIRGTAEGVEAGPKAREPRASAPAGPRLQPSVPTPMPAEVAAPPHRSQSRRRSLLVVTGLALALLVITVGGAAAWRAMHRRLDPQRVIVTSALSLGPSTAIDALDAKLRGRLADGIIETGLATIVPVQSVIAPRSRTPGSPLTLEEAGAIGRAARARYVVAATYTLEGDSLQVSAQVQDAETGLQVGWIASAGGARDVPEPAIEALRSRVMAVLAARLHPKFESWAYAAAMPATYESISELQLGIDAFAQRDLPQAMSHFRASAALDTTVATPLVWAAFASAYSFIRGGSFAQAESVVVSLVGLPRRFGPWDHALMDVVKAWVRGDLAGAHAADHQLMWVVPNSEWGLLLAWDAFSVGRAREAVRVLRRIDPERGWISGLIGDYWLVLNVSYHLLGDYEGELAAARHALRREPDNRGFMQMEVKALAGLGREREVAARCAQSLTLRAEPRAVSYQPCDQAILELWAHGHQEAARRLADRMIVTYAMVPDSEKTRLSLDLAETYVYVRNFGEAERVLRESPSLNPDDPDYLETVAVLSAARGDRVGAEQGLQQLEALSRIGRGETRPDRLLFRRARVAALLGDRDEAVNWLTRAFREGLRNRNVLHWEPSFDKLRSYPPFEALMRPVDDPENMPPQ